MARRKSVHVVTRTAWPTAPAPNATIAEVTVDMRVFYPHDTMDDLREAEARLTEAAGAARRLLQDKMLELLKQEGKL